mmetsp:Transcript_41267/g.104047  ORF Transcript_41267/g.104047 Transcript_41267/m.104047 type:complete len:216 (+) Transcript_41267:332-979(+)
MTEEGAELIADDLEINFDKYQVCKFGIHGHTVGRIEAVGVAYEKYDYTMKIVSDTTSFCHDGDSGSVIWGKKGGSQWSAIGVLFIGDIGETYAMDPVTVSDFLTKYKLTPIATAIPPPQSAIPHGAKLSELTPKQLESIGITSPSKTVHAPSKTSVPKIVKKNVKTNQAGQTHRFRGLNDLSTCSIMDSVQMVSRHYEHLGCDCSHVVSLAHKHT